MPFEDHSADAVILFEAIYYLPAVEQFVDECRRVLRPRGLVLIATANKDLYDFNPSPHSHAYYGVVELYRLFAERGFAPECSGHLSIREVFAAPACAAPGQKSGRRARAHAQNLERQEVAETTCVRQHDHDARRDPGRHGTLHSARPPCVFQARS